MYELLQDLRVLDLTRLLPGGYATQILGDLGAEILKVEDPWQGDYMRWMMPHFPGTGESPLFWGLNRNKKSMKLNLKTEEGKEIFLNLVAKYDVVIEGFRPGVMERLGLGYEELKKANPGIILCSISGYGQDGPYKEKGGHDINFTALAGILGLTGSREGKAPVIPPVQLGDLGGGALMAVIGVLTAYIARQRTGQGQYIDLSMLDGVVSWMTMLFMEKTVTTADKIKPGEMLLTGGEICYNVYQTKDGRYMALGALEPKFWEGFCDLVQRPDLVEHHFSPDPRIKKEIEEIFRGKTQEEWIALLEDKDICCEPILHPEEVKAHPQVQAREMFISLPHPQMEDVQVINNPIKFPRERQQNPILPPKHGEHTEEILLQELGLNRERVIQLKEQGII